MLDILLPVDGSTERALDQAHTVTDLGFAGDVRVTVFHVFTGENPEGATVSQVAAARRARDHLEEHGIEVTLDESSGDPADSIIERAREIDADLITLAGRRRSPAGKLLMGSVSQDVLLRSDRAVLFCPDEVEEP